MKNLLAGEYTWLTFQVILGWVVNTVKMTLYLPPHWENRFNEVLAGIPHSQKHIGEDKWYQKLGEILSVAI